jgi:hypothetical protein
VICYNLPFLPEVLPSKTLDTITRDSVAHFARNRYSEATAVKIVDTDGCDKKAVLEPLACT